MPVCQYSNMHQTLSYLEDEGAQQLVAEPGGCDGEVDDQDLGAELRAEVRVGQQRRAVQLEPVADVHL